MSRNSRTRPVKAPAGRPVEALENRVLLSGDVLVSVFDGNLRIRGDAAGNVIAIDQAGLSADQVRITGTSGTSINGQGSPVVLSGVTGRASIRMGTGPDRVTLSDITLPGDAVLEQRYLTVTNADVAGSLTVFGRADTTISSTTIGGNLDIQSTYVAGRANVNLRLAVQGTTSIEGGNGADVITIDNATFGGSVAVSGREGADFVQIEGRSGPVSPITQFNGPVAISLGTGRDTLQIGVAGQSGNRAVFAQRVLLDGRRGFDTLFRSDNNQFLVPAQLQIVSFESNALRQRPINLGAAAAFAVMATASITSSGTTMINGDVGLNPGSSQGIPPAQVNGTIHVNDPSVIAARLDLAAAYQDAVSRTTNSIALPGNLGGLTLAPGLYTNATSVLIEGSGPGNNLTLDGQGDPNAVFIFKIGSTLTTGPGAQVILAGGAQARNVFWQVGSSATLNTTTIFKGNILAAVTITVNNGSVVTGRLLAGSSSDGSATVNASTVTLPL